MEPGDTESFCCKNVSKQKSADHCPEGDISLDEIEKLMQEKMKVAQLRAEAVEKLRQEEMEIEKRISELEDKRNYRRKNPSVPLSQQCSIDVQIYDTPGVGNNPQENIEMVIDDRELRLKLLQVRDSFQHDKSRSMSIEDSRYKGSSLERAKATLSGLSEQADPAKLVETLLSSQDLDEFCSALHKSVEGSGGEDLKSKDNEGKSSSSQLSSSTPILSSDSTPSTAMTPDLLYSPIDHNSSSMEGSTPKSTRFAPKSACRIIGAVGEVDSGDSDVCHSEQEEMMLAESDDFSDDDKYATARGTITLNSYSNSTEDNQQSNDNQTPYVKEKTIPEDKLHVDLPELQVNLSKNYKRDGKIQDESLLYETSIEPQENPKNSSTISSSGAPRAPPRKRKSVRSGMMNRENCKEVTSHPEAIGNGLLSSNRQSVCSSNTDSPYEDEITIVYPPKGLPPLTIPSAGSLEMLNNEDPTLTVKTATLGRCHANEAGEEISDPWYHMQSTLPIHSKSVDERSSHSIVYPLTHHMRQITMNTAAAPPTPLSFSWSKPSADSDEGSMSSKSASSASTKSSIKHKGRRLKQFIGKAINKVKHANKESSTIGSDQISLTSSNSSNSTNFMAGFSSSASNVGSSLAEEMDDAFVFKGSASNTHKGPYTFDRMKLIQDMSGEHTGPVWTVKFSICGKLLATGGQDAVIRVWVLKDSYSYFDNMRQKYNETHITPSSSVDCIKDLVEGLDRQTSEREEEESPFMNKIFMSYRGHTADVLDLSWSKSFFLLSSSMDKTVRLWHISRVECLCCFQHIDFVTAIVFHPRDDRYFLSGSLDGKLRFWSIPDKKVAIWNEVSGSSKLITALNFCHNGKFAVVGTYDGRCVFFTCEQLKYFTTINVRSTRGKNSEGHKVTGIEPLPHEDKILVTTNDSRLRLYDLRDLSLTCKYRGCTNDSSQIKASFSHDGDFILSGSEDQNVYIWRTYNQLSKFSTQLRRRDRNDCWEAIHAHQAVVTAAVFSPNPNLFFKNCLAPASASHTGKVSGSLRSNDTLTAVQGNTTDSSKSGRSGSSGSWGRAKGNSLIKRLSPVYGYIMVTADYTGSIKVLSKQLSHN